MGQCDSDLSGQIMEGFLEEMVFGLKSEGRLGKKQRDEYSRQGEQRVQGLGGRRKLGGSGGVRRHLLLTGEEPVSTTASQDCSQCSSQ